MHFTRNEIMLPEHVELCERVYQKIIDVKKIDEGNEEREPLAALVMTLFRHGVTEESFLFERALENLDAR